MSVIYLNFNTGAPASDADRSSNVIDAVNLKVGAIATLSVKVQNDDPVSATQCTVQFFTKHGAGLAAAIPTAFTIPSNPPPLVALGAGASTQISIQWDVQNVDLGTTLVYAQIQRPGIANPDVTKMINAVNAREPVIILNALAAVEPVSPSA